MPLSIERAVFARTEFRKTTPAVDAAVKTRDSLAQELTFASLLYEEADANILRDQILALRKINRNDWALAVRADSKYSGLEIGSTITLFYPRFNLGSGKNFIVKKIAKTQSSEQLLLTLFGPQ